MGRLSTYDFIIKRISIGFVLLSAAVLALGISSISAVQAQTNSLPAPSQGAAVTEQDILNQTRASGSVLIAPETVKAILTKNAFTIRSERAITGNESGHVIVAFSNGSPFVFLFKVCASDGCLFMEILHLMDTSSRGLRFTADMANSINASLPYGTFTSEKDGNLMVRADSITRQLCVARCLESDIGTYYGMLSGMYELVATFLQTQTVENDNIEPSAPAFAAAMTGPQLADISRSVLLSQAQGFREGAVFLGKIDKQADQLEADLIKAIVQNPEYARFFEGEMPGVRPALGEKIDFPNLFPETE